MGFTCQVVRGFWCIFSLFRARSCWGGGGVSVANALFNGHESVGNYTLPLDHSVRSDICQLGCHGESWNYVWCT